MSKTLRSNQGLPLLLGAEHAVASAIVSIPVMRTRESIRELALVCVGNAHSNTL